MVLRETKSDEKDQKILANRASGGSLWQDVNGIGAFGPRQAAAR